ncbi:MAG: hypothetical protein JXA01_07595 [Dehalococcoidia bacterium]|nr:hypothetical protein [Dehalococcoidia bacterium]
MECTGHISAIFSSFDRKTSIKRLTLILLNIAVLASSSMVGGCNVQQDMLTVDRGQEFKLAVGQTALIAGEQFDIKFAEVITDSRCPANAICIWQGEVTCLVEITVGDAVFQKVLLQSGQSAGYSMSDFRDYQLTFRVEPYPLSDTPIDRDEYRLSLVIDTIEPLTGGILVTFEVVNERYSIFVTNESAIQQIFAVERGESNAGIPSGRIIDGPVFYNQPWSWHIDPEDIQMAELTIELCDGTPSMVEENLDYWLESVGRFCPWSASIVEIQDFRNNGE